MNKKTMIIYLFHLIFTFQIFLFRMNSTPRLDPRTSFLTRHIKNNETSTIFMSADDGEIPITILVDDVDKLQSCTFFTEGKRVKIAGENKNYLVTGRIIPDKVQELREEPFVKNVHAARCLKGCSSKSLDIQAIPYELNIPKEIAEGEGVIIGIVDSGADFCHPHFRNSDGSTRIEYIWDQHNDSEPNDESIQMGYLYSKEDIDRVLLNDSIQDKYEALGYDPGEKSHGSHVMDIAAGSGSNGDEEKNGVAPKSTIIFVNVMEPAASLPDEIVSEDIQDIKDVVYLANSVEVIEAVAFIFEKAGDRPCVVNLSLGDSGGSHDGTSDVELAFEGLLFEKPNRAIVISAGNFGNSNLHQSGYLTQETIINWKMNSAREESDENSDFDFLEIWYSDEDDITVEICNDELCYRSKFILNDETFQILDKTKQKIIGEIYHCSGEFFDNQIFIARSVCDTNNGTWFIKLIPNSIKSDGKYHAFLEIPSSRNSSELTNSTSDCTLGSIATGENSIVVSSYRVSGTRDFSYFSSIGPTRTGKYKPEFCASGQDIWAAASKTTSTRKDSGTSQAAPVITGIVARIFSVALARNINLTIDQTREILISSADITDFKINDEDFVEVNDCGDTPKVWNSRYGFGRLTIKCLEHELLIE